MPKERFVNINDEVDFFLASALLKASADKSNNMETKILLIDIGGIFFYPAWRLHGVHDVSKRLCVNVADFKAALDKYKKPFYIGKISEIEYWQHVLSELKVDGIEPSELKSLYRMYVQQIPEAINLLPKLSSKFTLLSFNNSPKEWMDYRIKIASLDKYFSEFFTSGYLGYMKPEDKMYKKIISLYKADDLFYLDDNEEYISIAKEKYGINGKKYDDKNDLLQLIA